MIPTTEIVPADATETVVAQAAGRRRRFAWPKSMRSGKFVVGLAIVVFFVLLGVIGPLVYRVDPSALSHDAVTPPSLQHLLGTTQSGQDCLAQLIQGTSESLLVGFVAGILATVLSVIVGLIGGYLAGVTDEVLSALSNIFLVIPALPLVIVLAAYLPSKGWISVALVISLTGWAWGARVLRVQTMSIRKRDYIEAARASGEGMLRIVFREILPNEIALISSTFLFTVIFAVLTQAGLSFLGLSDVSTWSWGTMLFWAENQSALQLGAWWWFVPPGLCIALLGTALSLMNFGIDELVNPRLRLGQQMRKQKKRARPGAGGSTSIVGAER
jgi:ABC-type dipeptide/oligopeptide/nickel transport system permease subunit